MYKLDIKIGTGNTLEEAASQLQGITFHGKGNGVYRDSHIVQDGGKVSIVLIREIAAASKETK